MNAEINLSRNVPIDHLCLERFHSKYISTCVDSSISRYSLTEG